VSGEGLYGPNGWQRHKWSAGDFYYSTKWRNGCTTPLNQTRRKHEMPHSPNGGNACELFQTSQAAGCPWVVGGLLSASLCRPSNGPSSLFLPSSGGLLFPTHTDTQALSLCPQHTLDTHRATLCPPRHTRHTRPHTHTHTQVADALRVAHPPHWIWPLGVRPAHSPQATK